eukprot:TRINITY_DN24352_c0_g9_i1.p1 TRINITY_DN24352_c0_g9~~TRINITY_DN24352_c0_g9_i1.p1  ORF type:complete len:682 (-),score=67.05 TRINITY_DN24352_c0_g9_i1:37-2082(-)
MGVEAPFIPPLVCFRRLQCGNASGSHGPRSSLGGESARRSSAIVGEPVCGERFMSEAERRERLLSMAASVPNPGTSEGSEQSDRLKAIRELALASDDLPELLERLGLFPGGHGDTQRHDDFKRALTRVHKLHRSSLPRSCIPGQEFPVDGSAGDDSCAAGTLSSSSSCRSVGYKEESTSRARDSGRRAESAGRRRRGNRPSSTAGNLRREPNEKALVSRSAKAQSTGGKRSNRAASGIGTLAASSLPKAEHASAAVSASHRICAETAPSTPPRSLERHARRGAPSAVRVRSASKLRKSPVRAWSSSWGVTRRRTSGSRSNSSSMRAKKAPVRIPYRLTLQDDPLDASNQLLTSEASSAAVSARNSQKDAVPKDRVDQLQRSVSTQTHSTQKVNPGTQRLARAPLAKRPSAAPSSSASADGGCAGSGSEKRLEHHGYSSDSSQRHVKLFRNVGMSLRSVTSQSEPTTRPGHREKLAPRSPGPRRTPSGRAVAKAGDLGEGVSSTSREQDVQRCSAAAETVVVDDSPRHLPFAATRSDTSLHVMPSVHVAPAFQSSSAPVGLDAATMQLERLVEETHRALVRDGLLPADEPSQPGPRGPAARISLGEGIGDNLTGFTSSSAVIADFPSLDAVDRALEELQQDLREIDGTLAAPLGPTERPARSHGHSNAWMHDEKPFSFNGSP